MVFLVLVSLPVFDVIIRGGLILDGSGALGFKADVGIVDDEIRRVGDLSGCSAEKILDASGLVVAPGFIDIHNHSDLSIFLIPTADNYVLQGVTTLVVGNCGCTPAPITDMNLRHVKDAYKPYSESVAIRWRSFGEYMKALDELEKSVNIAPLVGQGTVRTAVLGAEDVKPNEAQLREMKELVEEAMKAGAFGLSTGLIYLPGMFTDTWELVELAKTAAKYGGLYASHIRDEGLRVVDAVLEAISIGVQAGLGVEISHLKASGTSAWGKTSRLLALIEDYAERGFDVSADAYPYTAASTGLASLLPSWVREGGTDEMLKRLQNPKVLERIREEFKRYGVMGDRYVEWSRIVVSYSPSHGEAEGRALSKLADDWSLTPLETVAKLLIDDEGVTGMILHVMCEEDVERVVAHPLVAVGSDGYVRRFGEGKPHPRNYGAFPRVLAEYVRRRRLLTLPEAVRKMTSLPARKLKLWDRGLIRPGMKADIVVFNPHTVRDTATFEDPHRYPRGIGYVLVNGTVVVEDGRHTGAKPGRVLRKKS